MKRSTLFCITFHALSVNSIFLIIFSLIIISFILISCNSDSDKAPEEQVYHTPEALETYLQQISQTYPGITHLEPAGSSIEGRTIWALSVSDNPLEFEAEPKIRLTGSIHGDENPTTELLVRLIDYLISGYLNNNTYIKNLVDSRYITIIPMMNPDGVVYETRYNANNVDLNRNFDEHWMPYSFHGTSPFSEMESQSIRDFSDYMKFHTSLTFHTGVVIVNMPFDYASEHDGGEVPQESGLVDYLALEYSTSGKFLESPGLLSTDYVTDGTINGGDWYIVNGSLQDWSYVDTGCLDLTVEISVTRPETSDEIDKLFEYNRDSILAYIEASGIGIYGTVTNSSSEPVNAEIEIDSGDIITNSDDSGYYHRILLPGDYIITFTAEGYEEYSGSTSIEDTSPIRLDVTLEKK